MKKKQVHLFIVEGLWEKFKKRFSGLGYSTKSEFFRDSARRAIQEASESYGHQRGTLRVGKKANTRLSKFGSMKKLEREWQNVTKTGKGKVVEVHFDIGEELWRSLLAVLPALGYYSVSEFFRAKIREAINWN